MYFLKYVRLHSSIKRRVVTRTVLCDCLERQLSNNDTRQILRSLRWYQQFRVFQVLKMAIFGKKSSFCSFRLP